MSRQRQGTLYLRGNIWWMQYYSGGKASQKSTGVSDREEAERVFEKQKTWAESAPGTVANSEVKVSAIGTASELLVSADLIGRGYEVYRALCQHASCDMIAVAGDAMYRVEVKTGYRATKHCSVRPSNRFDVLAVVVRGRGIIYSPDLPNLFTVTKTVTGSTAENSITA